MYKMRVIARVYDATTVEYVQRINEVEITQEAVEALEQSMDEISEACTGYHIKGFGHGDSRSNLCLDTPLKNQLRYFVCPRFEIVKINDAGDEKTIICWSGI